MIVGKVVAVNVVISSVIQQAIRYERNLAELYLAFHNSFPEDAELWWDLSVSEQSHASLLESGQQLFGPELDSESIEADVDILQTTNDELESLLQRIAAEAIPRKEAFRIALSLECAENEQTLHRVFRIEGGSPGAKVLDKIRSEDQLHSERIRSHAESEGIAL